MALSGTPQMSMRNRRSPSAMDLRKKWSGVRRPSGTLALKPVEQPGPSIGPQQIDGARRQAQDARGLVAGQTGEEAQFHQLRGPRVGGGELLQHFVKFEEVVARA